MYSQLMKQVMTGMQQDAQANLPVIPNNGNPQGANNMPGQPTIPQPPGNAWGNKYSWLAPSPSMAMVQQMLAQPIIQPPTMGFNDGATVPAPAPAAPPVLPVGKALGTPRMGFNDGAILPRPNGGVMPPRQTDVPVLPRGLGYAQSMRR